MKMRNRNVPVIERYHHEFNKAPVFMATGFAGYLLFMKGVQKEGAAVYGVRNNEPYLINDEHASYFYDVWNRSATPADVVDTVLSNESLWGMNLSNFTPFADTVKQKLSSMITNGVRNTISNI
jgi:tagaturonate reductase